MTRPDGGSTPPPITDQPERTFWPAMAAPRQNFGTNMAGGLPAERFRRECRQQLRNLLVRAPKNCSCPFGLRVAFTGGAPESVKLSLVHVPPCPRATP